MVILKKLKNKNAYILVISSKEGLKKVITLINNKIRIENKLDQIVNNILSHERYKEFKEKINLKLNKENDLNNSWLSGFSDADASFQIKLIYRKDKIEVRLNFQIDQKKIIF